jgi:hypothetical protein
MTSDSLKTYLQDHLAGAMHAIEILKEMGNHYSGQPLGEFAAQMLVEIEADRDVLASLIEERGVTPGGPKEWGAWLAEKVSRLKLTHESGDGLGTFEALEFLVLGIHGKWALWRALSVIESDPRLRGTDFGFLISRAQSQHDLVEERRLAAAQVCFLRGPKSRATDHH